MNRAVLSKNQSEQVRKGSHLLFSWRASLSDHVFRYALGERTPGKIRQPALM